MPKLVLKLTEARAEDIKIQCVISSCSGACQLNMSPASGFDYPHIRIESRESASSAGSCKGKQLQMCTVCKRFFLTAEEVGSRVKCPTLTSHCLLFGERDNLWGRSRLYPSDYRSTIVQWWQLVIRLQCDCDIIGGHNSQMLIDSLQFVVNFDMFSHHESPVNGTAL